MKLTFDIIFFPNIARVAYFFGFLALITVIVIGIRILKDRNGRCGLFWGICSYFIIIGVICGSRVKYEVKDYIDNQGYKLVVKRWGLYLQPMKKWRRSGLQRLLA